MAKGTVVDRQYLYQQLVIERLGIENMFRCLLFGNRLRKKFNDGVELANFLYKYSQTDKIKWFLSSPIDFIEV